jgi:hypothetical protein
MKAEIHFPPEDDRDIAGYYEMFCQLSDSRNC